jgi:S-DNA-T family DNA segregation ATPase FtsK/SpoIIIE
MAFPLFAPRRGIDASAAAAGGDDASRVGAVPPNFSPTLPPNTRVRPLAFDVLGPGAGAHGRLREGLALVLWTAAIFLALALGTYASEGGANWVGPVGEASARGLVALVGIVAWTVPLELALLGIPFVTSKPSNIVPSRLAGDVLIALIGSALVQVGWPQATAFGTHAAGGLLGELFGELARSLFSTIGSFLVGFACLGLILIGRASFSFIAFARAVVELARRVWTGTWSHARGGTLRVIGAWREARELDRETRRQTRAADAPHIADTGLGDEAVIAAFPSERSPVAEAFDIGSPPLGHEMDLGEACGVTAALEPSELEQARLYAPPKRKPRRRKDADKDAKANDLGETPAESTGDPTEPPAAIAKSSAADIAGVSDAGERRGRKPRAAPADKGPTIVDTSASLKKLAPTPSAFAGGADDLDDADDASGARIPIAADDDASEPAEPGDEEVDGVEDGGPSASPVADDASGDDDDDAPEAPRRKVLREAARRAAIASNPTKEERRPARAFQLPGVHFLVPAKVDPSALIDRDALIKNADLLVKTLSDYGVSGKVEDILPGPTVTTYEVSPAAGTKVSKVASLADDLALALARKVRIVAPIPGKNRIGFELPNEKRIPVNLRDLVEDRRFQGLDVPLPVVLGRDILGNPVYADLASMPHVIVAGATGAGKSVGLNVMLTSLLYRRTPEELRLLMIDPKVVELAPFDRIPHMLLPVVTDMKQAATALKWAVDEMERRYQLFADAGTKNIGTYNGWVQRVINGEAKNPLPKTVTTRDHNGLPEQVKANADEGEEGVQQYPEKLPMIVIVVDEFADLMMQQGKEVEAAVARLAQKARAAGMHVILATQRPSVDVITGMIKANFPTRVAYRVAQKVDSRTILDEQGAEHLLGRGDMLIKLNGTNETKRVQCPWVSEEEVQVVTDFLRSQGEPVYDENILKPRDEDGASAAEDDAEQDAMYDDAVRLVAETRRCSTSWLQRKLGLGYNRAARIVEMMEKRGLVGPSNGAKDREVLIEPL